MKTLLKLQQKHNNMSSIFWTFEANIFISNLVQTSSAFNEHKIIWHLSPDAQYIHHVLLQSPRGTHISPRSSFPSPGWQTVQ